MASKRIQKATVDKPTFIGRPHVKVIRSSLYEITQGFHFRSKDYQIEIEVYPGFQTIFDNIPRIPFAHMILKGRAELSAIVHDIIYRKGTIDDFKFTRLMADRIMLEAMKAENLNAFYRYAIYLGVRIGGWYYWNKYRSGEWDNSLELDR